MIKTLQLVTILLVLYTTDMFAQCLNRFDPLEDRIEQSSYIVEGRISKQQAFRGETPGMIYTDNTIEIFKVFKGNTDLEELVVTTSGGRVGQEELVVTPSLELEVGYTGIFLLMDYQGNSIDDSKTYILRPTANTYSFLSYDEVLQRAFDGPDTYADLSALYERIEKKTGRSARALESLPSRSQNLLMVAPSITSISPTTVSGGTFDTLTINGINFGNDSGAIYILNANSMSGQYSAVTQPYQVSWSDTEIKLIVPPTAGTSKIYIRNASGTPSFLSTQTLTVQFNQYNERYANEIFVPRLVKTNGSNGYVFSLSSNTANGGVDLENFEPAKAAVRRALESWQTEAGAPFYLGDNCGSTAIQQPATDGVNLIAFESAAYSLSLEHSVNTIAVMFKNRMFCDPVNPPSPLNPTATDIEVVDLDFIIRQDGNGVSWEYGPDLPSETETDFETMLLHEFGHALLLQHINSPGAVMHQSISRGYSKRTLGLADDIAGASHIMNYSMDYEDPFTYNCGIHFLEADRVIELYDASNECAAAVVPVSIEFFKGKIHPEGIGLFWETGMEVDNAYFLVERSSDGKKFEEIGIIQGNGTTELPSHYEYMDLQPTSGVNYYRLNQIDFDGTLTILGTEVFNWGFSHKAHLFPNPITNFQPNLDYESPQSGTMTASLWTQTGQKIKDFAFEVHKGPQRLTLNLPELNAGIYLLKIRQQSRTQHLIFIAP